MREKVAGNEEYEVNGETYQYGAAAYRLEDSITLSQTSWSSITGIQSGFILDGQGYTISGLEGDSFINLVAEGAVIRNLTVDGEIRNGSGYAILTIQNSGTIENCQVTGSIAGSGAAGLVSDNYGTIKGCTSDVNIEASNGAGGIALYHNEGIIENCVNTGDIHGLFDMNHIKIDINTKHPAYSMIHPKSPTYSQAYVNEILSNAITMIIVDLKSKQNNNTIDLDEECDQGTILAVLKYFSDKLGFKINDNYNSLLESIKTFFDKEF